MSGRFTLEDELFGVDGNWLGCSGLRRCFDFCGRCSDTFVLVAFDSLRQPNVVVVLQGFFHDRWPVGVCVCAFLPRAGSK